MKYSKRFADLFSESDLDLYHFLHNIREDIKTIDWTLSKSTQEVFDDSVSSNFTPNENIEVLEQLMRDGKIADFNHKKSLLKSKTLSLEGKTFFDLDLSDIDLSFTNLKRTGFTRCNLSNAKFINANLLSTSFGGCNLSNVDFTNAMLYNTDFRFTTNLPISKEFITKSGGIVN